MPVPITLKSPLPAKDLLFESMTASAGLSMLGEMQLGLLSAKSDLKPEDLLGKPMTVTVPSRDPTAAPLVEATSPAAASEPASLAQTEPGLSADQRAALLAELAPLQLKLRELQGESLGVSDGDFSYSFD